MSDPLFAERYMRAAAHDRRFDGYFVTGIRMSEIFCRPGCATRAPRPTQVTFYPTAAAAHAAGLTPCPRCRPDMTCAAPDIARGDTLAARALRLIADGEIDRTGVDGLARRLSVTTRQVLRAVETWAGCGPLSVARSARAHLARLLLTATTIPISEVATAAGFTSVRQFNSTILQFYGTTPGAIRGGVRGGVRGGFSAGTGRLVGDPVGYPVGDPVGAGIRGGASVGANAVVRHRTIATNGTGPLVLRCSLPVRQPFDAAGIFAFLTAYAITNVEEGGERWYARTVRLPHGAGHFRVDRSGATSGASGATSGASGASGVAGIRSALLVQLSVQDPRDIGTLYSRVRRLFDADADPVPIDARLAQDPALAPSVVAHPGVRVPGTVDIEETLFRIMIEQQTSAFAARALLNRLARLLGEATPWGLLFPTIDAIAEHARAVLTGPPARIDTIIDIAHAIVAARSHLHCGCSRAELANLVSAFPGVDASTADRVMVRVLGQADVLLADDADLRRGAGRLRMPTDPVALAHHGMLWLPWQSYAGMHLWYAARGAP